MVAGRRYFDAGTVDELRSQHRSDRRPRLGVLSGQADSALERVIGQCLDEEPQKRPASARVLLASLPGGDRLEAAIAAGETPAPDVVADASVVGDLRPATAWIVLASAIGGLGLSTWLLAGLSLLPTRPPPKTPEILTERARGILSRLGHDERPVDSAGYFEWDDARFRQIRRTDRAPDRFLRLRNAPLSWLLFVYRQGPEALIAQNRNGVVQRDDPPLDVPGMLEVVLDPQGRLTRYTAIPPEVEAGGPWPEPDWSAFFHEAELDVATFRPVPSEWRSPVDSDRRAAWEGSYSGMPELTVRIEAAAYHGRAVWFALLPPWMAPEARSAPITEDTTEPLTWALVWALIVGLAFGALLLARRNLRLKRGDRKGALRVALFVFAAYSLARLFRADHLAGFWPLITVFAYPLAFAALIWVFYIALEPYARRQWPRILISWGRLLAERWRDPMIGRDVLVGVAAGALGVCLFIVWQHVGTALGQPGWPVGSSPVPEALSSWRNTAYRVFVNLHGATLHSILRLFLLVLLRVLLRRERWALAGWGVLLALTQPLTFEGYSMIRALADAAFVVASVLIDIVVLTRFGLLGLATEYFVGFLLLEVPLTFDASLWWAPRGWVVLTVLTALAVYGFRTSLAGKPAFGRDWLEA
jgi:serine/threonine-protein kinase